MPIEITDEQYEAALAETDRIRDDYDGVSFTDRDFDNLVDMLYWIGGYSTESPVERFAAKYPPRAEE